MDLVQRPVQSTEILAKNCQGPVSGQPQVERKAQVVTLADVEVKTTQSGRRTEVNTHVVCDHPTDKTGKASLEVGHRNLNHQRRIGPGNHDADFAIDSGSRLSSQPGGEGQIEASAGFAAQGYGVNRNGNLMGLAWSHLQSNFRDHARVQTTFCLNPNALSD